MRIERNGNELVCIAEDWENLYAEELQFLRKINLAGVWTDFDEQDRLKLSMFDGSGSTNKRRILALREASKIFKIALSDDIQTLLDEHLFEAEQWIKEIRNAPRKTSEIRHEEIVMRCHIKGQPYATYKRYVQ